MKSTNYLRNRLGRQQRLNWSRVGFVLLAFISALLFVALLIVAGHFVIKHW